MWEKYCTARQATDDSMAHAHCMLDTWGYKRTLSICKIYCFSTATTVARTRLNVTLYVHCQSPCQTWWWPYRKGPKHVVYLVTPYTVIKCCVLTHPPDIILIFDTYIACLRLVHVNMMQWPGLLLDRNISVCKVMKLRSRRPSSRTSILGEGKKFFSSP